MILSLKNCADTEIFKDRRNGLWVSLLLLIELVGPTG